MASRRNGAMQWLKIKPGAQHGGVSPRTFEAWLKSGLRYIVLPSGLRLTKASWIDDFLQQYEATENRIDQVVADVLKDLGN